MSVKFDSESPSWFYWGIRINLEFNKYCWLLISSQKLPWPIGQLGFWDKVRSSFMEEPVETGVNASIEVAFKEGKTLWGVKWLLFWISKTRSSGKLMITMTHWVYFDILAEKLSWYIPNYLANTLMCWTSEGSKSVFLPIIKTRLANLRLLSFPAQSSGIHPELVWWEEKVVELREAFIFQLLSSSTPSRKIKEKWTSDGTTHYEVKLCNPQYTEEKHDS